MKVMVVEDDRSVRETVGMVLDCYSYEFDLIDDGASALKYLESSWPDVMLLDLTLTDMTGEELYSRIRERFGHVPPTVVLSAAQNGAERISKMPGARFLAKPYTLDQLTGVLEDVARLKNIA